MAELVFEDKELIAELFDAQPESVVWFKAIHKNTDEDDPGSVTDFVAAYCNDAACRLLNTEKEHILGNRLLQNSVLNAESSSLIFKQCRAVYYSGEPMEYTYYNDHLKKYYNVLRSKVKDGVLAVSRDKTREYLREKEYTKQAARYNTIIDSSGDGVLLLDAIRDDKGTIIDFSIAHCNEVAAKLGQMPGEVKSKSLLSVLPHLKDSQQFEMHRKVVETGVPVHFETTFRNKKGEEYGWFIVSLTKLDDSVFSRFVDISDKKKSQAEIEQQAAFLNSILDASINCVFACEAIRSPENEIIDLRILKVNKAFTQLVHKTIEEVVGKSYLSLFPSAGSLLELNKRVIETGEPLRKEIYYKGENLEGWFDISIVRQGNDGLVVTFTDITERKNAFEEIEQQRNLLDSILKHSASGICVIEVIRDKQGEVVDGKIIVANEVAAEFSGIPLHLSLTKPLSHIDKSIIDSALFAMSVNALKTGQSFITESLLESTGKWLQLAISKMDQNRLVCVFTDVTDRKNYNLQMEKLVEELKRSNASLEEFTYAASHDLKEPIRKVRIFADRLIERYSDKLDSEGLRILERLEVASERMAILVNDLLEYSHVSLEHVDREEINLNEKIQRVLGDLELEIEEKKARIVVGELPTIKGYRRQVQQLFQNLISNALKYSTTGTSPAIEITSKVVKGSEIGLELNSEEEKASFYAIAISDNGIGFEQKDADKIFKVFQRLHPTDEYSGTGVGLSISKKVVRNHRGHITAKGEPGKGATFTVYFPC